VGRAVGRLGDGAGRAAPTLASIYRRLPTSGGLPYGATIDTQHRALLDYYGRLDRHLEAAPYQPRISIVVPTYRPVYHYLDEMLGSIALQTYSNWQLCIVDDASGDAEVTRILSDFAESHPGKVAFHTRTVNGHIAAASNDALAMAEGVYVALLDHDDRLYPHALAEVVLGLNAHRLDDGRYPLIVYTDERMIDEDGAPIGEVWLKPDWMPLLHLTSNYTNHLTVYARDLLTEVGGFRSGFDGSQDHDLMLRATEASGAAGVPVVHVPTIAYQWRSHPGSVAKDPGVKSYSIEPAMRAVAQACVRRGRPAKVWREPGIVANRIDFELGEQLPAVCVAILPAGGNAELCASALDSGQYPNLVVTVAAGGAQSPAAALDEVLSNTEATYLAIVADTCEARRTDWVAAMVGLASLPEVAAVGALLLRSDGAVAAAGHIGLGSTGVAPALAGAQPTEEVYLAWPASIHEVLSVPGRAMLVDVAATRAVGGFAADPRFAFIGWDVDLCLRLREHGQATAFTPYAEFIDHAGDDPDARRIALRERTELVAKWSHWLSADPYFNPGLARSPQFRVDPSLTLPEIPQQLFAEWLRTHRIQVPDPG
jgi:GT2 family glycosyltransferase